MQLVIMIGPPGSGKSTIAKSHYGDHIRVSQDEQGKDGHEDVFEEALFKHQKIVVDRMNFDHGQRKKYEEPARRLGYTIVHHIIYEPYGVCLRRMLARKDHPTIKNEESAKSALHTFFTKFEYPTGADVLIESRFKHDNVTALICDLDGTLCNIDHRLKYVRDEDKKKRSWPKFFEAIPGDGVNGWCLGILNGLCHSMDVVLCSGRGEEYRQLTEDWLADNDIPYLSLYMRRAKDYRQDALVKEIILDFELLPYYNIVMAIDDRKQVVEMWRRRGIVCLQCAEGEF
jgi:predicted kinase